MPADVRWILKRFEGMRGRRTQWEEHWQDIADLVMPTRNFNRTLVPGSPARKNIYDDTASIAHDMLSSALHGLLTNPATKWFGLRMSRDELNDSVEIIRWLQDSRDRMFSIFNSPGFGFGTQSHEVYQDLAGFGTSPMLHRANAAGEVVFRTMPLSESFIDQDWRGTIDTLFRKFEMKVGDMVERWGEDKLAPEVVRKLIDAKRSPDPSKLVGVFDEDRCVIHAVYPRSDADISDSPISAESKRYASVYVDEDAKHIMSEKGFDQFPYLVPRWSVAPGEIYGRSPAMMVLNEIRMLNAKNRQRIQADELAIRPPLMYPANSIEGPIRTQPGALIPYRVRPGGGNRSPIEPLNSGVRPDIATESVQDSREVIRAAFHLDKLTLPIVDRATTVEIRARLQQQQQVLAPVVARLASEFLGPLVKRTFGFMVENGKLAPPPFDLGSERMEIDFVSPLAMSQKQGEVASLNQFLASISGMAEVNPAVLQNINGDEFVRVQAESWNVNHRVMHTDREVQQIRQRAEQERQQQQQIEQAQQVAQAAESGAKALVTARGEAL